MGEDHCWMLNDEELKSKTEIITIKMREIILIDVVSKIARIFILTVTTATNLSYPCTGTIAVSNQVGVTLSKNGRHSYDNLIVASPVSSHLNVRKSSHSTCNLPYHLPPQ